MEHFRKFIRLGTSDPEYPGLINIKANGKGSCSEIHETRPRCLYIDSYWCELKTDILVTWIPEQDPLPLSYSGKKGLVINPLLAQDLHNHTTNETFSVRLCWSNIPSFSSSQKIKNKTNGNFFSHLILTISYPCYTMIMILRFP